MKVRYAACPQKPWADNPWYQFDSFDVTMYGARPLVLASDGYGQRVELLLEKCEFDPGYNWSDTITLAIYALMQAGWDPQEAAEHMWVFMMNHINVNC